MKQQQQQQKRYLDSEHHTETKPNIPLITNMTITTSSTSSITIIHRNNEQEHININSSFAIHLPVNNEYYTTRLVIPDGIIVSNVSTCLDTDDFRWGRARLLFRRCDGNRYVGRERWTCLLNFLGRENGGKSLPPCMEMNLSCVGPCTVEFMAEGSFANASFHLVGHVGVNEDCGAPSWLMQIYSSWLSQICSGGVKRSDILKTRRVTRACINNSINMHRGKTVFKNLTIAWLSFLTLALPVLMGQVGNGKQSGSTSPSLHPLSSRPPTAKLTRRLEERQANLSENAGLPPKSSSSPLHASIFSNISPVSVNTPSEQPTVTSSTSSPPTATLINLSLSFIDLGYIPSNTIRHWNIFNSDNEKVWTLTYPVYNHSIMEDTISLPEGNYTLSLLTREVPDIMYILSSDGIKFQCGFRQHNATFTLPYDPTVESGCASSTDSLEMEIEPLQCYLKAVSHPLQYQFWSINDSLWFDGSCGPLLEDACESRTPPGFNDETLDDFCEYHQCAYGSHGWDYFNCQCLLPVVERKFCQGLPGCRLVEWYDNVENRQCCNNSVAVNDVQASSLSTSCGCYLIPLCEDGDIEMCAAAGEHCCTEGDVLAQNGCRQNYLQIGCDTLTVSLCEDGDTEMCALAAEYCCTEGDRATRDSCRRNYLRVGCDAHMQHDLNAIVPSDSCCIEGDTICREYYSNIACERSLHQNVNDIDTCADEVDARCGHFGIINDERYRCECDFWEPMCNNNPGGACEEAVQSCCRGGRGLDKTCSCQYYSYAMSSLGYTPGESEMKFWKEYCHLNSRTHYSPEDERDYALVNLYKETGGEGWINNTGWLGNETTHCEWFGITCNDDGRVSAIELQSNNLTGSVPTQFLGVLLELTLLNMSNNQLSGTMSYEDFYDLSELTLVDISANNLHGRIDVLLTPSIEHFNFSFNHLERIDTFKKFKTSHQTLHTCDLSHNKIRQSIRDLLTNIPPFLQELILSDNLIEGNLPDPFETMTVVRVIRIENNMLIGTIPDIVQPFPRLRELNLSNQTQGINGGLSGSIPGGLSHLDELVFLDLSSNRLNDTIPAAIGYLPLKIFNVSKNLLTGSVPREVGQLGNNIEIFDLSDNDLTGLIPSELGSFDNSLVLFRGNKKILRPSPLSLCFVNGFDLKDNEIMCPPERNALYAFFVSAKGQEWTKSYGWGDEYALPCTWYGVVCSNFTNQPIVLNLTHNGLSGTLNGMISNIPSLSLLDLSDNQIKGSLPSEIGGLNLKKLRLSYNAFTGEIPTSFEKLQQLELLHLHGNWLVGSMPRLNIQGLNETSSFITDCGVPSTFDRPLECPDCSMCCNSVGMCQSTEKPTLLQVDQVGFHDYQELSLVFVLTITGLACFLVLISSLYDRHQTYPLEEGKSAELDGKYALEKIGKESSYSFFLSDSKIAWGIAFLTVAIQTWVLFQFVSAAKFDIASDNSDYIYSWSCPYNDIQCVDTSSQDWTGWAVFALLMFSYNMTDILNGSKLLVLSAKRRHEFHFRFWVFVSGLLLLLVTSFTVYTSVVYNLAIARSNTDIMVNSVIILFITDIDEQLYKVLSAMFPKWIQSLESRRLNGQRENYSENLEPRQEAKNVKTSNPENGSSHQAGCEHGYDSSKHSEYEEMKLRIEHMTEQIEQIKISLHKQDLAEFEYA